MKVWNKRSQQYFSKSEKVAEVVVDEPKKVVKTVAAPKVEPPKEAEKEQ